MGSSRFMSRMFDPSAWGAVEVLVWVIVAIMVVALVVLVVRGLGGRAGQRTHGGEGARSALQVLEDRHARGELSDEEFDRRRQVLERTG